MKMNIIVYTKPDCKWCVMAKEFLTTQRTSFEEVKVGEEISVERLKELFPLVKTVPVIVVDGVWIGGYTELIKYFEMNGWLLA